MSNEEILKNFLEIIDEQEDFEVQENDGEISIIYTKRAKNEKTGEEEEKTFEISTFLIPVEEKVYVTKDDQYSEQTLYLYNNGQMSVAFNRSSVSVCSRAYYVRRFGGKVFCEFTYEIWKLFFDLYYIALKEVPVKKVYIGNGWIENNTKFIHGDFIVGKNKIIHRTFEEDCEVEIIASQGEHKFVLRILENLSNNKFAIISIVLFYLLSLLKSRFYESHQFSPMFSLAIIGKTGSRKTSTARPLINPTKNKDCECSFTDSMSLITRKFKKNLNGCTLVDDFKINSTANNDRMERIIRLCGDDTSNGGIVVGGRPDETVTTGLALFTGEEYPKLQSSSFPRMLMLSFDENTINNTVLTELVDNIDKYNSFIHCFIQYIMNVNEFDKEFITKVENERKRYAEITYEHHLHGRYPEMLAWMSVMWDYMNEFFSISGIELDFDYKKELLSHIIKQHNKFERDPVTLFIRAFFELKDSNRIRVIDYSQKGNSDFDVLERSDEYFIKKDVVFKKVIKLLKEEGIELNITEKALLKALKEQDLIGTHRSNLNTHEIKINSYINGKQINSVTGYNLKKHILNDIGGKIDES